MGSPTIFSGRRTKVLTADGLLLSNNVKIDNDGVRNYISNGHAEVNTTGWSTFADAAATSPVDGTGGSPNSTWTRTTSSALNGQGSFLFTRNSGASRQGEGVSYDFTINSSDKAKVLQISFNYLLASGSFTAGTSSTDSELTVWVYDVTNAVIIQPSSYKLLSNSTTVADTFNATFQTSSNSTSYRLIIFCGSTTNAAFTMLFDQVTVSPSTYVYGTPITDWQSYTPTIAGAGTPTNVSFLWRRVGDSIQIQGVFTTGTVSATAASFTLPSGLVIDTAKTSSSGSYYGEALRHNASGTTRKRFKLQAFNGSTNLVYFVNDDYTTAASPASSIAGNVAWSNTEVQSIQVNDLPILGWSSSVQMSDQTDTRVVVASIIPTTPTGTINSGYNAVVWSSITNDTHGGYNASTGRYTVSVPGYYRVSATLDILATLTTGQYIGVRVGNTTTGHYAYNFFKAQASVTSDYPVTATGTIYAKAGDVLGVDSISSGSTLSFSSSLSNNFFAYERVSGPSAIAATELVSAKYILTGDQTGVNPNSSYVKIQINNRVFDSHGAMDTSNYRYVAPVPGTYMVTGVINIASTNVLNNLYAASIHKNGSSYQIGNSVYQGAGTQFYVTVSTPVQLRAGEYVELYLLGLGNNSASTLTASSGGNASSLSVHRIGNY